ncbi:uncharacterized protein Tco025E_01159 [Trypanosoma conorhini]|uniref:Uncharacterized protein n=1 Tax=Trypanosoma conorhini TaxID=83891 RepID=A0A422Q9B8_9TRYP|nr:uncharacterized protein Tco025E_01159 [Trypanosoma conorhini]RNF26556.1 hypothetical protein Tco025E_01159 [Trypanosoma conorhini]
MSTPQLLERARGTSLLLASEAHLPQEEVSAAFEAIRATEAGYEVLYTVTVGDNRDRQRVLLCHDANEAKKVQDSLDDARFDVYALRRQGDPARFEPRRSGPSLVPSAAVVRREYRVVTREEAASRVEGGGGGGAQASPQMAAASPKGTAGLTGREEEATTAKPAAAALDTGAVETKPPKPEPLRESQQPNATSSEKLLKKTLSGGKRTRAAEGTKKEAEAKPKKRRVTSRKSGSGEETQSLRELARASAKKRKITAGF